MEQTFPATADALSRITDFVTARAEAEHIRPERIQRLQVALEEAVVNVCDHAYDRRTGDIRVRLRTTGRGFEVDLEDEGPAFDPLAAEGPDTSLGLDERKVGGLGVLLMRRLLDDVRYRREGNRNVLTLAVGR